MTKTKELVRKDDAIEGQKVGGSSRKPLLARGPAKHRGIECFRFVSKQDVKANISEALNCDAELLFEPGASRGTDAEITCETAIIHSLDDAPKSKVGARTHTHQATFWNFSDRTGVRIDAAHQGLVNAIAKRERRLASKTESE